MHWTQRPRPGWKGGLREWLDGVANGTRRDRVVSILDDIAEFVWRAFCLQWVAVAWCMLIGCETPDTRGTGER